MWVVSTPMIVGTFTKEEDAQRFAGKFEETEIIWWPKKYKYSAVVVSDVFGILQVIPYKSQTKKYKHLENGPVIAICKLDRHANTRFGRQYFAIYDLKRNKIVKEAISPVMPILKKHEVFRDGDMLYFYSLRKDKDKLLQMVEDMKHGKDSDSSGRIKDSE